MTGVVASVLAPSSVFAQQHVAEGSARAVTAAATNSRLLPAPSGSEARTLLATTPGAWALSESAEAAAMPGRDVRAGPNVALMVVGGAALVTGLVIGGDGGLIIATGGAVVGLVGLYRYMR